MRTRMFCLLVVALVLVPTVLTTAARGLVVGVMHAVTVLLGGSGA